MSLRAKKFLSVTPMPFTNSPSRKVLTRLAITYILLFLTHVVDLTESTIEANKRFFASADDVPKQAYTIGIGSIMRAKRVLMIVSGKGKADIVKEAFFGPITPKVPASILQLHNDFILIGDAEALSCL